MAVDCDGLRWNATVIECDGYGLRWLWTAMVMDCDGYRLRWLWTAMVIEILQLL
jgi:hypothetical protein